MRDAPSTRLLTFFLLGLLSKVCAQLCPHICTCPWPPPQCPLGVPLVLDGCNCCQVCARRLGEPCDHRHVCDPSQGLVCQRGVGPGGLRAVCLWSEEDEGCEVNGRQYRDGDTFQPHCGTLCHCEDGGVTCVPLCSEDIRLPSEDCPNPRRVTLPGRCCPEWVCNQSLELRLQPLTAPGSPLSSLMAPLSAGGPCPEWSTAWGPCSASCGLGVATRVSNQNRFCRLESQHRLCLAGPCPPPMSLQSQTTAI
ncbi:CCN family member 5 [Suncus etruscus]|uniref:CCN family member 5 n=1 Tax=Suncus etruscus TaxID=109475 RepID=UPI002110297A|nr:CCN family member 5 [Suncus etruscus]